MPFIIIWKSQLVLFSTKINESMYAQRAKEFSCLVFPFLFFQMSSPSIHFAFFFGKV